MAARLSELSVLVTADTRGLVTGMEEAETRTRRFSHQAQGATRDVGLFARGSSDMTSQLARMSSGVRAAGSGMQGFGSALAGSAMALGGPVGLIAGVAALGVSLGTTISRMSKAKEETEKTTNALNLYTAALEKAGKVPQAPIPTILPATGTAEARIASQPIQQARLNEAVFQAETAMDLVEGLKKAIAGAGFSETSAQGRFFAAELAKAEASLRKWTGMVEIADVGLDALTKATEAAATVSRQPWENLVPIWRENAEEARDFRQATEDAAKALRDARASADKLADAHAQNAADEFRRNSQNQEQEFSLLQQKQATLREADIITAQTRYTESQRQAALQVEQETSDRRRAQEMLWDSVLQEIKARNEMQEALKGALQATLRDLQQTPSMAGKTVPQFEEEVRLRNEALVNTLKVPGAAAALFGQPAPLPLPPVVQVALENNITATVEVGGQAIAAIARVVSAQVSQMLGQQAAAAAGT